MTQTFLSGNTIKPKLLYTQNFWVKKDKIKLKITVLFSINAEMLSKRNPKTRVCLTDHHLQSYQVCL